MAGRGEAFERHEVEAMNYSVDWDGPGEADDETTEESRRELRYAHSLAVSLAARHYPDRPPFEPLPDLLGLLTQIDNMTTGLERKRGETGTPDENISKNLPASDAEND